MDDFDERTRIDKFDKRRKNTRNISLFLIIGAVLLIILIGLFALGGNDEAKQETVTNNSNTENAENGDSERTTLPDEHDHNQATENNQEQAENEDNNQDIERLEPEDEQVIEAYTEHWDPVGTDQSEPHTVNYNSGSQDRVEMEKAIQVATDLDKNDISYLWLANNGDQQVLATLSDSKQKSHYRVYMSWADSEGWQPKKVEILRENDQMYRFE